MGSTPGQDPEYPASELLTHSSQTKGWQTARFCDFPQAQHGRTCHDSYICLICTMCIDGLTFEACVYSHLRLNFTVVSLGLRLVGAFGELMSGDRVAV